MSPPNGLRGLWLTLLHAAVDQPQPSKALRAAIAALQADGLPYKVPTPTKARQFFDSLLEIQRDR